MTKLIFPMDYTLYRSMIGGLLYLTNSRLDIMHEIFLVARFQNNPKQSHEKVVKIIFRYLKGISNYGLQYKKDGNFSLSAYTNAN